MIFDPMEYREFVLDRQKQLQRDVIEGRRLKAKLSRLYRRTMYRLGTALTRFGYNTLEGQPSTDRLQTDAQ